MTKKQGFQKKFQVFFGGGGGGGGGGAKMAN